MPESVRLVRTRAEALANHPAAIVAGLGATDRAALTDEAWATNAPAVALMLDLGFDPGAISPTTHNGGTALHCAAWQGSAACVAGSDICASINRSSRDC